jgi:hypothetical protein
VSLVRKTIEAQATIDPSDLRGAGGGQRTHLRRERNVRARMTLRASGLFIDCASPDREVATSIAAGLADADLDALSFN